MEGNELVYSEFEKARPALVSWVRMKFRVSVDDAEDIVQCALMRVVGAGFRGGERLCVLALLYRACYHAGITHFRRLKPAESLSEAVVAKDPGFALVEWDAVLSTLDVKVRRSIVAAVEAYWDGTRQCDAVPRSTLARHRKLARRALAA